MDKATAGTNYAAIDRILYLLSTDEIRLKSYMAKFECSRATAVRDLNHVRDFYDIDFQWDKNLKIYKRHGGMLRVCVASV